MFFENQKSNTSLYSYIIIFSQKFSHSFSSRIAFGIDLRGKKLFNSKIITDTYIWNKGDWQPIS